MNMEIVLNENIKIAQFIDMILRDYIKLLQENRILKENAEHNDKVVDKVNFENQLLKKENKQLKAQIEEYQEVSDD